MLATRLEASAVDVPYPRTRALRICQRPRFRGHRQQAVSRTTQKQALSSRRRSQLLSQAHVRVRLMVLRVAAQVLAEVLAEFSYRPIAELIPFSATATSDTPFRPRTPVRRARRRDATRHNAAESDHSGGVLLRAGSSLLSVTLRVLSSRREGRLPETPNAPALLFLFLFFFFLPIDPRGLGLNGQGTVAALRSTGFPATVSGRPPTAASLERRARALGGTAAAPRAASL